MSRNESEAQTAPAATLEECIQAVQICIQAGIHVFLWGDPGIGKTASLQQEVPMIGEPLWVVILALREPSDQAGLPVVRPEGVYLHPPRWAAELAREGHGVVFFDELNAAPPPTQSSALRLVQDGYAGDLKLPGATTYLAAGNAPERVAGVYHLTAAMANRWLHLPWAVDIAGAWADGMIGDWPEPPLTRLPKTWTDRIPAARSLVASFARKRPACISAMPLDRTSQGRAWPSPRTWTMAATAIAAAAAAGFDTKSSLVRLLVTGCVGVGSATEFFHYVSELDLRDPEEYLKDPMGTPLPKRQDHVMATLDAVAAAVLTGKHSKSERLRRHGAAWRLVGRVLETQSDLVIPACRSLAHGLPDEMRRDLPDEFKAIARVMERANIDLGRRR